MMPGIRDNGPSSNLHTLNTGAMRMKKIYLLGGAIEMDMPETYIDASTLRQIPDSQEVFVSQETETSIVLEILDLVTKEGSKHDLWNAISYHFNSIAYDNEALSSRITSSPPSPPLPIQNLGNYTTVDDLTGFDTPTPIVLVGNQSVRKFRSNRPVEELPPPDDVVIFVALWRVYLENGRADGQHVPSNGDSDEGVHGHGHADEQATEAARERGEPHKLGRFADVVCSVNVNRGKDGDEQVRKVAEWFERMVESMEIKDYQLFIESEYEI